MGIWQSSSADAGDVAPWKANIITKPEEAVKVQTPHKSLCIMHSASYEL